MKWALINSHLKKIPMGIEQFLLKRAYNDGFKEGLKKREDKILQGIIKNARVDLNLSIETIANLVNLSPKTIRLTLKDMGIECLTN
jgi:predicted lipid carrier protein YhbT